ncbi:MAG: anthranilate phosphoribosyltransferase [Ignavibacteriales bacterium]|nr:anthranilate phosphoribosyltransferase [Ignavibacteriales bacterium]
MIREVINKLSSRQNLSKDEAYAAMNDIMSGNATEAQIAAFLMGLRLKGETVDEIAGCATSMREQATQINSTQKNVIDTCGTGGDASGTFNISTTAAIIASAGGAVVAKHGNRAVSSKCGSADVLKALGVNIEIPVDKVSRVLNDIGITFLFAPMMHGAMKYAAPVRKDLGIRTIFNVLGPLTNPAGAKRQVLGVFDASLTEVMASVLAELGSEHAFVVHGEGGFDELSTLGWTKISELKGGTVNTYKITAQEFGFSNHDAAGLGGGDAARNSQIIRDILNGNDGAPREISMLNAAAAFVVAAQAQSLKEGLSLAKESVDSGAALRKLNQWIEATNS